MSSAGAATFEHDLFVIHAQADGPFVHGHLLPAVGLAPERVMLSSALALGASKLAELERGVLSSRLTVVVISPAYAADRWAEFAEQLAGYISGATGRLVPLLRTDCELPSRLELRVPLDFRDPACWAEEAERLRAHLQQEAPEPVELPCPYPGMRPYSADTATYFHGREVEIDELIGRLRAGEREIYVIGPSGSGKSSLVAAGLMPRLARGVTGIGPFLVRSMRPGEQPATRLGEMLEAPEGGLAAPADAVEALLARRSPAASVLIVIDQLEELFTLASTDECARFLVALSALRAGSRCVFVLTLRADFYGVFMESPLWKGLRGRLSRIEVGPLDDEELRVAIARPARDAGVFLEPELVERLLADAASEPGILPLLQETLVQLWDRRRLRLLTLADYQALGDGARSGLAVALARRADAALRVLPPTQEAIARRIFLRLVSFGEGRSDTRRQQPRSKLGTAGENTIDFEHVLRKLIDDRLLTTDDDDHGGEARVDLAHEVMIAAWPTLAGWIRIHRADEQRRRQLEAAAAQWVEHGCGVRGLLDPIELADAEAWQQTESAHELGRSAEIAELVGASRAAQDRQRRRRRGLLWSAFATLTVFAVVVAILAIVARRQAGEAEGSRRENQRLLAESYREAGRKLLLDGHPHEAVPYLVAARQKGDKGEPIRMLFWAATRSWPLTSPLKHGRPVRSAAFSPDGDRIVTASDDHTARIWDIVARQPLRTVLPHESLVLTAAFSPDGTRVVTASSDQTARVWDATTGEVIAVLRHRAPVRSAAFSPEGTRVITASEDHTARLWNAATGALLADPLQHQGWVVAAAFSPDGARVVTASHDRTARVWDAGTGEALVAPLQHRGPVWSAVFSPDGTRVVTASDDDTACIWNVATGAALTAPLQHRGDVWSAAFSPDGARVVTASHDHTAGIWDTATGKPLVPPLQHLGEVWSAAFGPDGTRIVTASSDGTVRVWDVATGKPLVAPLQHQATVWSAAFNLEGTRVVTTSDDRTARAWDVATGKPLASPLRHQREVWSAAFSPDNTRIVTASLDSTARVWDAATGRPLTFPLQHQREVWSAAFSPDGTRVVTASDDRTARIWDAATGRLLTSLAHQEGVRSAAFSPDGTLVLTASDDDTVRVWDAATGKPLASQFQHRGLVRSAAFSPDGSRIVTASYDRTVHVWHTTTGKLFTSFYHGAAVRTAAFDPDGTRVVTASDDWTARVWHIASGQLLAWLQHQGPVLSAAFSPEGARIVTASSDHTARVWDAETGTPLASPLQHRGPVLSAAFSSDGTRVVTASEDHTACVWDAALGKPLALPFQHQGPVLRAVFSSSGSHVITASADNTARVWETWLDGRTLAEWSALAEQGPFVISGSVHVLREPGSPNR